MYIAFKKFIEMFLDTLNVMTGEVRIGISNNISRDKRDGIIHLKSKEGGIVHTNFIADDPEKLLNPTFIAIRSLFKQITKMGMTAEFIEIRTGGQLIVYKQGNLLPIYKTKHV